jgi:hypothetical protein
MRVACAALAAALAWGAGPQGRERTLNEFAVNAFKSNVGYTESPAGVDPNEGVLCDWPAAPQLLGLDGAWQTVYDAARAQGDAGVRKVDLHEGTEELSLEIYVASGIPAARRHLLEVATNTMMREPPYRRGPANLGDLSIVSLQQDPVSVVWTLRNVCFHLSKTSSPLPLLNAADALDRLARRHIVPGIAHYQPRLSGVQVSGKSVPAGQTLTIQILPAPGTDGARLTADFAMKGRQLQARSQHGLTLEFTASEPGAAEVLIHVIDKLNLMTRTETAKVDVTAQ